MGESHQFPLLTFLSLFARLLGFFLFSPLFSGRAIPLIVRFGLALATTLLIAPPLSTQIDVSIDHPLLIATQMVKELAIGYLLGFLFSLIVEAAALGGQIVGTLTGFSATELLDPSESSKYPLIGRFFALTVFLLFLTLDLHHSLLRLLYESFQAIPTTPTLFSRSVAIGIVEGTGRLFQMALAFSIFPMLLLLIVFVTFAVLSRHIQIFWTGFPIQILIGIGAIGVAVGYFGQIVQQGFYEFLALVKSLLFPL